MKGNLSAENAFIWLYFMMDFMMDIYAIMNRVDLL